MPKFFNENNMIYFKGMSYNDFVALNEGLGVEFGSAAKKTMAFLVAAGLLTGGYLAGKGNSGVGVEPSHSEDTEYVALNTEEQTELEKELAYETDEIKLQNFDSSNLSLDKFKYKQKSFNDTLNIILSEKFDKQNFEFKANKVNSVVKFLLYIENFNSTEMLPSTDRSEKVLIDVYRRPELILNTHCSDLEKIFSNINFENKNISKIKDKIDYENLTLSISEFLIDKLAEKIIINQKLLYSKETEELYNNTLKRIAELEQKKDYTVGTLYGFLYLLKDHSPELKDELIKLDKVLDAFIKGKFDITQEYAKSIGILEETDDDIGDFTEEEFMYYDTENELEDEDKIDNQKNVKQIDSTKKATKNKQKVAVNKSKEQINKESSVKSSSDKSSDKKLVDLLKGVHVDKIDYRDLIKQLDKKGFFKSNPSGIFKIDYQRKLESNPKLTQGLIKKYNLKVKYKS